MLSLPAAARVVADTTQYVVYNHDRVAGAMRVVTDGDSVVVRFDYQDRQRGPHLETRYWIAADGALRKLATRGTTAESNDVAAGETFEVRGDTASWRSEADSGRVRLPATGVLYFQRDPTPYDMLVLARALMARADRHAPLVTGGDVRAEVAIDTTLGGRRARLVMLRGLSFGADGIWLDEHGALLASAAGWFTTIRRDDESLAAPLRDAERAWRAAQSATLAKKLAPAAASALVIRNGDVFDSEHGITLPGNTIVVQGDRITAVGPAASVRVPNGAMVIDATGKTVIPGMWDMHTHLDIGSETSDAVQHLAAGVTTVRDMASDPDLAVSERERSRAGTLLGPRYVLAGFIEGPGLWAGPTNTLVRDEAEARAWVARYDSLGYRQIKLYNLVHPDLVPAIAAEAHKRGMRLSGHVPRGLTVPNAVRLGFDEINHAAFLFSTFFQDSLYVPRMRAYSGVATIVAPTFDVDGAPMTELIEFLREHGTVIDPTLDAWVDRDGPLADGTDPVLGPTLAWMPAPMRRALASQPPDTPQDGARDHARTVAYLRVVRRLYDAGVTIVPGTDFLPGLSYHGELEIYERAGIPAPAVLQIATIVPARVMKDDKDYGSIAPGKIADLVIVDGHPDRRITDLRRAEWTVRAGKAYRTRDLYAAADITPAFR